MSALLPSNLLLVNYGGVPVLTGEDVCSAAAEVACLENPLNTQMIWPSSVINPIRPVPPVLVLPWIQAISIPVWALPSPSNCQHNTGPAPLYTGASGLMLATYVGAYLASESNSKLYSLTCLPRCFNSRNLSTLAEGHPQHPRLIPIGCYVVQSIGRKLNWLISNFSDLFESDFSE